MKERLKELRKSLGLTQQEFANRIGINRGNIATYETRDGTPGSSVVNLICREFNVNEEWLRTGVGEMFNPLPREAELSAAVHKLLSGETTEFKTRLIELLADLGPQEWDILESYALKLAQNKPTPEETIEQEARLEAERYYEQLISEKKQALQALSANESDAG